MIRKRWMPLGAMIVTAGVAAPAYGQFWPPACEVRPAQPTCASETEITLGGLWPDSCVPNGSNISVHGDTVHVEIRHDYPPDIACLTVITGWSRTETLRCPLAPGSYTVAATLLVSGVPIMGPTSVCVIDVGSTPADVNGDCAVDVQDLVAVILAWGPCADCPEDIDGNGFVNVSDLVEVLLAWSPCPPG